VLHVRLDSSEQERPENLVQLLDDRIGLGLVFRAEPRIEVLAAVSAIPNLRDV
jgi:hypothetical protein